MVPLRILLADDHVPFRNVLASVLALEEGFEVVGVAGDGVEAVELARQLEPDVILMDIAMPVMSGLAATRQICDERPDARVIIFTASETRNTMFAAVASGAAGCLPKKVDLTVLYETLRQAARGGAPAPASRDAGSPPRPA